MGQEERERERREKFLGKKERMRERSKKEKK